MKTSPFEYNKNNNLVVVLATLNGYKLKFALDTGASDTIVDTTALILSGGLLSDSIPTIILETASGKVKADAAIAATFEVLGETRNDHLIYVYDFLQNGLNNRH